MGSATRFSDGEAQDSRRVEFAIGPDHPYPSTTKQTGDQTLFCYKSLVTKHYFSKIMFGHVLKNNVWSGRSGKVWHAGWVPLG